jgi:hypothetical protein
MYTWLSFPPVAIKEPEILAPRIYCMWYGLKLTAVELYLGSSTLKDLSLDPVTIIPSFQSKAVILSV